MNSEFSGKMKTKVELDDVWNRYNKLRYTMYIISLIITFVPLIVQGIALFVFDKSPLDWIASFVKKYWLIILIVAFIIIDIFERSKFNWKHFESLRVPLNKVAIPYKKAEEDIIYGIQRERVRWVKRGVERLEGLKEYLSEMPEYNELLEKGKSWLKENEGK